MNEFLKQYLEPVFNLLNYNLFALGEAKLTPLSILYVALLTLLLFYLSSKLKHFLVEKLLGKTKLDLGARQAVGTILRYFILFIGLLVILQTVGINLTTLNVLAGAIGIGVGFGLQNIASNFISGLIILVERPVKVGDRIEVGNVDGRVIAVGARSTRIKTNDNITIIVPNSKFISENVINWSFDSNRVRFRVPIGVAYDTDINLAKKLLLEIAAEYKDALEDPAPTVRLVKFDESSINLELWVWSASKLQNKSVLMSDLNFMILDAFRRNNIEIPYPQTDLRLRSDHLKIKDNQLSIIDEAEESKTSEEKEPENKEQNNNETNS